MREYQLFLLLWLLICVLKVKISKAIEYDDDCYIGPCYTMNLACNNNGQIKDCYNAKILKYNEYKNDIEEIFNKLRNDVAGGRVYRNLPAAARMAKMSWNKKLANYAKLDVSRCQVAPKPCISSKDFARIGRLGELYGFPGNNYTSFVSESVQSITAGWTQDIQSITKRNTLRLPHSFKDSRYYSTTLLMIEHNSQFGCAALRYSSNLYYYFFLSCIFGTDNVEGQKLYQWGSSPGIRCKKRDRKYTNLCAVGEKYNNDGDREALSIVKLRRKWS